MTGVVLADADAIEADGGHLAVIAVVHIADARIAEMFAPARLAFVVAGVIPLVMPREKIPMSIVKDISLAEFRRQPVGCDDRTFESIRAVNIGGHGIKTRPGQIIKSVTLVEGRLVVGFARAIGSEFLIQHDQPRRFRQRNHVVIQPRDIIFPDAKNDVGLPVGVHQDVRVALLGGRESLGEQRFSKRIFPWSGRSITQDHANLGRASGKIPIIFSVPAGTKSGPAIVEGAFKKSILGLQRAFLPPVHQIGGRPDPPVGHHKLPGVRERVMGGEEINTVAKHHAVRIGQPDARHNGIGGVNQAITGCY